MLRCGAPRVSAGLMAWLVALLLLAVVDVYYAYFSMSGFFAMLFLPNLFNYLNTNIMEALFADSAQGLFVRFHTLNVRLQSLLEALRFEGTHSRKGH